MNDNKVQKLSDETLDQVSGGGIGDPPTSREEVEAEIAQMEALLSPERLVEILDKKSRIQMLKGYLDWMK